MVGDQGGSCGSADPLTADVRAAYESAAAGWADGPELVYALLAGALVASANVPLTGSRVLDLGAGTGAAGRAAQAAGARQVVAVDLAVGMLRRCLAPLHPLAADAAALPFRDDSFDLVVAAFCLSHLGSIAAGLGEARRVGRAIAASAFAPASPTCRCARLPSRPGYPPRRSWHRGGWAWPTSRRSFAHWTRHAEPPCRTRPSALSSASSPWWSPWSC